MGMATIRFLVLLMCVWISSAEIRERDVIQQSRSLLLDIFEFSDAGGGIELNVTEIDIASSLSVPIIDADLSTIGFFLSAKEALMDLAIDLEATSCVFEWPHKNYFQGLIDEIGWIETIMPELRRRVTRGQAAAAATTAAAAQAPTEAPVPVARTRRRRTVPAAAENQAPIVEENNVLRNPAVVPVGEMADSGEKSPDR